MTTRDAPKEQSGTAHFKLKRSLPNLPDRHWRLLRLLLLLLRLEVATPQLILHDPRLSLPPPSPVLQRLRVLSAKRRRRHRRKSATPPALGKQTTDQTKNDAKVTQRTRLNRSKRVKHQTRHAIAYFERHRDLKHPLRPRLLAWEPPPFLRMLLVPRLTCVLKSSHPAQQQHRTRAKRRRRRKTSSRRLERPEHQNHLHRSRARHPRRIRPPPIAKRHPTPAAAASTVAAAASALEQRCLSCFCCPRACVCGNKATNEN